MSDDADPVLILELLDDNPILSRTYLEELRGEGFEQTFVSPFSMLEHYLSVIADGDPGGGPE